MEQFEWPSGENPRLKSFFIQNFKGIKKLEIDNLPKEASWIFLTGENGYGKTCVLQAIATTFVRPEEPLYKYIIAGNNLLLRSTMHYNQTVFEISIPHVKHGQKVIDKFLYPATIQKNIDKFFDSADYGKSVFPFIACYGSARLDTYSESSSKNRGITTSLFDSRNLLENIELQLTRWVLKQDDPEFKTKFESVTSILTDILQIEKIEVDTKNDKVLYFEKDADGNVFDPLTSNELAAGYRSIIAMIGDMILRLFETQPHVYNPKELVGIVIIDELDLHFHPKWQKKIPGLLSSIFPNIQFIVSTHSPIPLLGAPQGSVFLRVNRNTSDGITVERLEEIEQRIGTMLPNTILSSPLFGMQDIFPTAFNQADKIRTEDTWDEILVNDKLKQRLKLYEGSDLERDLMTYVSEKQRPYGKK